jgi:nicotinic acid mononucleotide adenylyltransferase
MALFQQAAYDLKRLFELRAVLTRLDPAGVPQAVSLEPHPQKDAKRVGVLSGSFNPLTRAHLELAREAKESFQLDSVLFALSLVTIDKERVEGISLEDRLLLLSTVAGELGWASVVAVNRGLYFEQARALRSLFGGKARLFFIVGMDKVMQIFDPRYYEDRDKALAALFTEASLIAAHRAPWGEEELQQLLSRPENCGYEDRVYFLDLPGELGRVSSSAIRSGVERGEAVQDQLPGLVYSFLLETGAYGPRYEIRPLLLERLFKIRKWAESEVDFKRLVGVAGEETQRGQRFRDLISSSVTTPSRLKDFILSSVG